MKKTNAIVFTLAAAMALALFTGCDQDPALMAGQWQLYRFGESEENYVPFGEDGSRSAAITVTVNEDNKGFSFSFQSVLNTYEGSYAINDGGSLSSVGEFLSTAIAGSGEDMQLDDELRDSITTLSSWLVGQVEMEDGTEKDALILMSERQSRMLVFTKP